MRWRLLLAYLLCWCPCLGAYGGDKVRFLALASEPIAYLEHNQEKGYFVDILARFGEKLTLEQKVRIEIVPYPRLLKSLREPHKGYLVTILLPNPGIPEQTLRLAPVIRLTNVIASLKDKPLTWDTLAGKKIGGLRGSELSYGPKFTQLYEQKFLEFVPVNRWGQGVEMLTRGRLDGYFGPLILQRYWARQTGLDWSTQFATPLEFDSTTASLLVSVSDTIVQDDADAMLETMTTQMNQMVELGEVKQIIDAYLQ